MNFAKSCSVIWNASNDPHHGADSYSGLFPAFSPRMFGFPHFWLIFGQLFVNYLRNPISIGKPGIPGFILTPKGPS